MNIKYFHSKFQFCCAVLASLAFVIYFVKLTFLQIVPQNIQGLSLNNLYTLPPPPNGHQKGENTLNTRLIQKQLFTDIL